MGSLIIVLLTTRSVAIPGAPHCRRWAEASGVATGARYAGTPVRLADKADVVKPPSAGEPLYCNAYLQVVSVKQALIREGWSGQAYQRDTVRHLQPPERTRAQSLAAALAIWMASGSLSPRSGPSRAAPGAHTTAARRA